MKKLSLTALLAGCIALVPITAAQADRTIGSTLKVKYKGDAPDDPYGSSWEFKGKVGPDECAKGRKVTIKGVGREKTEPSGKFEFSLSRPAKPGRYTVKVAEKTKGRVTCSKVKATLRVKEAG